MAFARAVADVLGDPQVQEWSRQFAKREISEKDWTDNLVNHAEAQGRDDLDDVYAAAVERVQEAP